MDGNCKIAGAGFGKNEMYPCFDEQVTYGLAVAGLDIKGAIPVALTVPITEEPNVRRWQQAVDIKGTIEVSGLEVGKAYVLLRYAETETLPAGPPFTGFVSQVPFTAPASGTWTYEDPVAFRSDSATYYFVAEATSVADEPSVVV
eukprot:SRR837773.7463.p2 GENE.SRR837773.7463~~SRR837773.7463.p2  ORF type:complete len:170 (-),score=21.79 SRR837773.7463:1-435(-)